MEINEKMMTEVIMMNATAVIGQKTTQLGDNIKHMGDTLAARIKDIMATDPSARENKELALLDHLLGHMGEALDDIVLLRKINNIGYKRVALRDEDYTAEEIEAIKKAMSHTSEYNQMQDVIEKHHESVSAINSNDPIAMLRAMLNGN